MIFLNNYNIFLNESRIKNLKSKYSKILGEDITKELIDLDFTDNKAYVEWLLSFYLINEENIDDLKLLGGLLKKFHNNKHKTSIQITELKTLGGLIEIVREISPDDISLDNIPSDEYKLWYEDNEWLIYQPFTFNASMIANKKSRDKNWCTTYDIHHFKKYVGHKGTLLYCVNKIDDGEDMAFEIINEDNIYAWDYLDKMVVINDVNKMKLVFVGSSKIYILMEDIQEKIEFPKFEKKDLKYRVIDFFDDELDINNLEESQYNKIVIELLEKTDFVENFINEEVKYYTSDLYEFISVHDYRCENTITFLIQKGYLNELLDHFNVENKSDIYDNENLEDELVQFIKDHKIKEYYDYVEEYINSIYSGSSAKDIIENFGLNIESQHIKKYVSDKDIKNKYAQDMYSDMSLDDLLEILF